MGKRIAVAGHIALDITPVFPTTKVYSNIEELFMPGKLINVGKAEYSAGGSVSNTGFAFKKLGADVVFLGKIGNDNPGRILESIYHERDAGGLIIDSNVSTSYTLVIAAPGIDRIFLHDPGANDTFFSRDIPNDIIDNIELFHFGYPPLMKSMYENDGDELLKIFLRVKDKGVLTSLDMAAIDPHSDSAKTNWRLLLARVLPYVDYFEPSLDEILYMLGPEITDARSAARECVKLGAGTVLIKCGTEGIYYCTGTNEGHQPCIPAPFVASATGAGDTSIAAFLYAILEGKSISDSVKFAAAEGSCCVTAYDAFSGLKTISELEEMIKNVG